jgi:hypothetical protein
MPERKVYLEGGGRVFVRKKRYLPTRLYCGITYNSVSQIVVRGPQVVLGFCPCGPLRLNVSPKKTEKY